MPNVVLPPLLLALCLLVAIGESIRRLRRCVDQARGGLAPSGLYGIIAAAFWSVMTRLRHQPK